MVWETMCLTRRSPDLRAGPVGGAPRHKGMDGPSRRTGHLAGEGGRRPRERCQGRPPAQIGDPIGGRLELPHQALRGRPSWPRFARHLRAIDLHYISTTSIALRCPAQPGREGPTAPPPRRRCAPASSPSADRCRSEEHTSELQSLMRISSAVFCLKKKKTPSKIYTTTPTT